MNAAELAALVTSWQVTRDDKTFEQILAELAGTIRHFSRHYHSPGLDRDDFEQRCREAIWVACKTWDPQRGGFRSFVNLCVRCGCLDSMPRSETRREAPLNVACSLSNPIGLEMCSHQRQDDWETERDHASSQHAPWLARDCSRMKELLDADELAALYDRISPGLTEFEGWCLRQRLKGWSAAKISRAWAKRNHSTYRRAYKAIDNASSL